MTEFPVFAATPDEPTRVLPRETPRSGSTRTVIVEPPRRHHRVLRTVVVLLVVILLVVAAVVTDQTFRSRSEADVARDVATSVDADPSTVTVAIHRTPFLAVLMDDRLDAVDVSIPTATVERDNTAVTFRDVELHGSGVRQARERDRTVVESATATGRVDWAELSRLAGARFTYADSSGSSGRVTVLRNMSVLGANVSVEITATPGVDPETRRATLTDPAARLDGISVPRTLLTPILDSVTSRFTLPDLGNLKYDSIHAARDGLHFSLRGSEVRLSDLT